MERRGNIVDKRYLLNDGMYFKNIQEIRSLFGYDKSIEGSSIISELKHYCNFHTNKDNSYIIDNVFENTKPFKMNYIYDIGDIIITKNGTFKILDRYKKEWSKGEKRSKVKTYFCECQKCFNKFEVKEKDLKSSNKCCPFCKCNLVMVGKPLFDERKDLLKYFVNIEDAKSVSCGSGKKVSLKCPNCGNTKEVIVGNLVKHGFSCSICNDGISYPNKFIRNMLTQLNIDFISEKSFAWSNDKIYDQYIEKFNMIIENHGLQHYKDSKVFNTSAENQQINDKYKKSLALDNGIVLYVELDCRKSEKNYIKNSVMNSIIPKVLSFSEEDVDWDMCDLFATKTIINDVCNDWENVNSISELAEKYKLNIHTITSYLRKGEALGWCVFEEKSKKNRGKMTSDRTGSPIFCKELNSYFRNKTIYFNYLYENKYVNSKRTLSKYIRLNDIKIEPTICIISKKEFNDKKNQFENGIANFFVYGDYYDERCIR